LFTIRVRDRRNFQVTSAIKDNVPREIGALTVRAVQGAPRGVEVRGIFNVAGAVRSPVRGANVGGLVKKCRVDAPVRYGYAIANKIDRFVLKLQ
jgi:hypothetical protein